MVSRARAKSPSPRKSFGPGRSALRRAVGARGRRLHNLWYHYSPRLGRDVVLRSDLAFEHFCWIEADPSVRRYELDLDALPLVIDHQIDKSTFDVLVEFQSAPPELRQLGAEDGDVVGLTRLEALSQAATRAGYRFTRITAATLAPHAQLIRNWRCALAFQAACRDVLLTPYMAELRHRMGKLPQCTLETLLRDTNPALRPQYLAGLFAGLQQGLWASDLDQHPLCLSTLIRVMEVSHE